MKEENILLIINIFSKNGKNIKICSPFVNF